MRKCVLPLLLCAVLLCGCGGEKSLTVQDQYRTVVSADMEAEVVSRTASDDRTFTLTCRYDRAGQSVTTVTAPEALKGLTAVLADGLDEDGVNGLRQAGYACWLTTEDGRTLTGSSGTRASTLIRHFTRGELARNYLLLDASAGETLSSVLAALGRADFQFRAPVAPAL